MEYLIILKFIPKLNLFETVIDLLTLTLLTSLSLPRFICLITADIIQDLAN